MADPNATKASGDAQRAMLRSKGISQHLGFNVAGTLRAKTPHGSKILLETGNNMTPRKRNTKKHPRPLTRPAKLLASGRGFH